MFPSHLARLKAQTPQAKRSKSNFDSLLNALRNAKELAVELKRSASTGWPLWWMGDVVLEYCARPDGVSILDAYQDDSVGAFRYKQHSRSDCFKHLCAVFDQYSHFGANPPSEVECSTHKIPFFSVFVWPSAVRFVHQHLGRVVAVCTPNGILWIADTGCGYHLVPECDVVRGKSAVVPNPGAQRLHTPPMAKLMLANVLNSTSLK